MTQSPPSPGAAWSGSPVQPLSEASCVRSSGPLRCSGWDLEALRTSWRGQEWKQLRQVPICIPLRRKPSMDLMGMKQAKRRGLCVSFIHLHWEPLMLETLLQHIPCMAGESGFSLQLDAAVTHSRANSHNPQGTHAVQPVELKASSCSLLMRCCYLSLVCVTSPWLGKGVSAKCMLLIRKSASI